MQKEDTNFLRYGDKVIIRCLIKETLETVIGSDGFSRNGIQILPQKFQDTMDISDKLFVIWPEIEVKIEKSMIDAYDFAAERSKFIETRILRAYLIN